MDGFQQRLQHLAAAVADCSRTEANGFEATADAVEDFSKDRAIGFIQENTHDPALHSYSSDATPMETTTRPSSALEFAGETKSAHRSGASADDFLRERFFSKARGVQLVRSCRWS